MASDDITFVFHKEWLDNMIGISIEDQNKIIANLVRYGCGVMCEDELDPYSQMYVNSLKGRIDYSKEKYQDKVAGAKKAGAKKKLNDDVILELARSGKNSTEIAEILGCSKSAIDHSEGWRHRKLK